MDATKSCVWKGEISELIFFQEENFPSSPLERLPQGHLRAKKKKKTLTTVQIYCCRWVYTKLLFLLRKVSAEFFSAIADEGNSHVQLCNPEQNVSAYTRALCEPTRNRRVEVLLNIVLHTRRAWRRQVTV